MLITLGMIGVVAAVTMPVLTSKIRNHELEVRFKRANSIVSQAVKLMENDLDGASINDVYCNGDMKDFIEDLAKYFPGSYVDKESNHAADLGYKNSYWYTPTGEKGGEGYDNWGGLRTNNQLVIYSSGCGGQASKKIGFLVDSNGLAKPNKMGYDAFLYLLNDDNTLNTVQGYYNYPEERAKQFCNFSDNSAGAGNGVSCIEFALADRFPNDETKSYWKSLP